MNVSDVKFHKNWSNGRILVPCERAEEQTQSCIHDEATSRFFGTVRTHARNNSALYVLISCVCGNPSVCILPVCGIRTARGL